MRITGTYTFKAPRDRVWTLLMDVEAIAACLPGCKGFRSLGGDRYEAELSAGVAAVSGDFKATIALADQRPPESYTLRVDANGRPGFVKGEARIMLSGNGDQTVVAIAATAEAGGMIARVGQRLIESVARMSMDRFFGCLATKL